MRIRCLALCLAAAFAAGAPYWVVHRADLQAQINPRAVARVLGFLTENTPR